MSASRELSRRDFLATAAAAVAAGTAMRHRALTAREIAERVRAGLGVPWREPTVDGFRAGDPDTVITGVATTAMATIAVLRAAAESGHNLVVAHEPTFYAPDDQPGARAADPVYLAKRALIDERRLVVWRLADHWRARAPDPATRALAAAMGWASAPVDADGRVWTVPATTVGAVVARARERLGARGGLRVIGDRRAAVRRVLVSPGTVDLRDTVRRLPGADLVLAGEPREWEAAEYAFDTFAAGRPRAMIALGRVVSEEPGVRALADWLRALVPELPVRAFPVGDPYWSPVA